MSKNSKWGNCTAYILQEALLFIVNWLILEDFYSKLLVNRTWWDPGWTPRRPNTHAFKKIHQVVFSLDFLWLFRKCVFKYENNSYPVIYMTIDGTFTYWAKLLCSILTSETMLPHVIWCLSPLLDVVVCGATGVCSLPHIYCSHLCTHKLIPSASVQVVLHTSAYTQSMKSLVFFTLYSNSIYKDQLFLFEWIVDTSYNIWHQ